MSEAIERVGRSGADQAPAARLGAELRATRQSYGWELPDLAASLRIRQSYLEAIEAGRISELPGTTYALGFVRAYASALGLPGDQVASRFRAESAEAIVKPALSFPAPVPQRGVPAGALMLLGLVILAGAYSGWYYVSEHQRTPVETVPPIPDHLLPAQLEKPAPSPQVASILPSTAPPAPVSPAAMPKMIAPAGDVRPARPATPPGAPPGAPPAMAAPPALPPAGEAAAPPSGMMAAPQAAPPAARIIVKATADAWVTVKQPGGPALLSKLMHAGESWPVPADKPGLLLTTGNAGGTEIDVDGAPVPGGLGASGLVRRDLPLDPAILKSGALPPLRHAAPKPPPPPPAAQ